MSSVPQAESVFKSLEQRIHIANLLLNNLSLRYGINRDDPNFDDTPKRFAMAFEQMLVGYTQSPEKILAKSFPSEDYDQMVVVKNIKFYSMCCHHLLPFYGFVSVGYIPNSVTKKVVGLSKIPRLVKCFSRRLQLQERMTEQIARALLDHLNPAGVGVVVHDSIHLCAHMRGVEESHSTMDTSSLHGEFRREPDVRSEFFRMIGK